MSAAGCLFCVALLGGPVYSPRIAQVAPAGGQRGTEVTITLAGERLTDPQELMLSRPGVEVTALKADRADRCAATLRIAPDCPLGPHGLRLRTATGISNLVWFQVGALPEVVENRDGDAPMPLSPGHTVNATLRAEEVDTYAIDLQPGATLRCDVSALRLGFQPIDVKLEVRAPDGSVLATADDTTLGHKDPLLAITATTGGTHIVAVSAAFADSANVGPYRLHLGSFPQPTGALPAGGQPGETIDIELLGGEPGARARVTLPADDTQLFGFHAETAAGVATTPIVLRVGGPPNATPTVDAKGRAMVTFPAALHGVIAAPDQVQKWFFQAKKDQVIEFRALARTLRSPLDPALIVRQADGRFLAYNDDGGQQSADSLLAFTAPADGEYSIEVRDLLRRGSSAHFFRLEGTPRTAPMSLRMVVNRREQPVVPIPRGGRNGCVLQATNFDAAAELTLLAKDLPAGVSASFGPILRGSNLVPLVLHAAADAELAGTQVDFELRAAKEPLARDPGYVQVLPLVTVRNDQPILVAAQRRLPVAVTNPAPFMLEVSPLAVPLIRGAPLRMKVQVRRDQGFTENIRVRALWLPPGVTGGQAAIAGNASEAWLPIEAAATAALGTFPLAVQASCQRGGGTLELVSAFIDLRVEEPFVVATPDRVRTAQGTTAELKVTLARKREPGGPIRAALLNLPRGVTATEVEVPADAESISFPLVVAPECPPGRHRGFVVELRVPAPTEAALHRYGGGEIRVDPTAAKVDGR